MQTVDALRRFKELLEELMQHHPELAELEEVEMLEVGLAYRRCCIESDTYVGRLGTAEHLYRVGRLDYPRYRLLLRVLHHADNN